MNQLELIDRAKKVLPEGGFGNFDPNIFIREGKGSHILDENGKKYIDYLIGSGPLILGHGNPEVIEVVQEQLGKGMTFLPIMHTVLSWRKKSAELFPAPNGSVT